MEENYWTRLQRRKLSRRRLMGATALTGAGLAAAAFVGCGDDNEPTPQSSPGATTSAASPTAAAQPKAGGTFRLGQSTGYPTSFDPHKSGASATRQRVNSRLFRLKAGPGVAQMSSDTEPDAAESFELVDGTTLNVKLRPNVKFGAPINRIATAEDVVFSFDRYVGSVSGTPPSPEAGETKRIFASWTAVDPRTVRFTLNAPQANVTYRLASSYTPYLMPKEAGTAYNPDTQAVGSGPWILTEAQAGNKLTFKKNPEWHGGPQKPYQDGMEVYAIQAYATRLTQFLGGNLEELLNVPGDDVSRIQSSIRGAQLGLTLRGDPVQMSGLAFSGVDQNPPWRDPRVRQAVSMGIDRDQITEGTYNISKLKGLGLPATIQWNSFIPVAMEDYWLDPKGEGKNKMDAARARYFKYDPDGAKRLLTEAGFPNGFSAKLHYTTNFGPGYNNNAELVAQFLSRIGVNLTLTVDDYQGVYVPEVRNKGNYDGLAFLPYGTFVEPGEILTAMYLQGGNRNNSRVNDPALETKIRAIESNLDTESRRKQILDLQNELADKMYYVPMQAGAAPTVSAYQPFMRNVLEFKNVADASANEPNYWQDK